MSRPEEGGVSTPLKHRINPKLSTASRLYEERLGSYHRRSRYLTSARVPGSIDLAFGDPQSLTSAGLVSVLQEALVPQDKSWFSYKRSHPAAVSVISRDLNSETGTQFSEENITLTNGQFGGLACSLGTICSPGDQVLFFEPSWFYYAPMVAAVQGMPVGIPTDPSCEPDLELLEAAITPRTAAVIINSPNNPTGLVYSESFLGRLAALLSTASKRHRRPIYVISDEAYRKVVFDGKVAPSPAQEYPWTIVLTTFTKSLLMPGLRIGCVALPSAMPDADSLRQEIEVAQLMLGWCFPENSTMYAVPRLHEHLIDVDRVQKRRDFLVPALRQLDLGVRSPAGALYCLVQVPEDDWTHVLRLEAEGLFVLPGSVMGAPGTVRVSLTEDEPMMSLAMERWQRAIHKVSDAS